MSSLTRLEGLAKIDIVSSLTENHKQLVSAARIILDAKTEEKLLNITEPNIYFEVIIDQWIAGMAKEPPTWSSLLQVLRQLDMEDVSIDIEDFMYGECIQL